MLLLLFACHPPADQITPVAPKVPEVVEESDTDTDADADTDTDTDADTDTDTDADTDTDTATDTGPTDTGGPVSDPIRFVAVGDAGNGNFAQQQVANAIFATCKVVGCDFALYLGDNFYPNGVEDTADPQWQTAFVDMYSTLSFPFFAVLGNHDWDIDIDNEGANLAKAQAQIDYSFISSQWRMPDFYYTFSEKNVDFYGLDTVSIDLDDGGAQQAWLDSLVAASTADWRIAFGHYPYLSNGMHGNAGNYENKGRGELVETFVNDSICGKIDLYLCGHDHSMQWIEDTCGSAFMVSGAGSSTTDLTGTNPTYFQESILGFVWIEIDGPDLVAVWYDKDGIELYRGGWSK